MPFSRASSQPRDRTHISHYLLQWQAGCLPLAPPGKPQGTLTTRNAENKGAAPKLNWKSSKHRMKRGKHTKSDNSADRNKPGCVHPQRKYLCHSEEEPASPWRDSWNQNENRGHGQQCPLTRPEWRGVTHRLPVSPELLGVTSEC